MVKSLYPAKETTRYDDALSYFEAIIDWMDNHADLCLLVCFILLGICLIILSYAIVGVSATDSGVIYNHLGDII